MKKNIIIVILLFIYQFGYSQKPGDIDLNFNPSDIGYGTGANNFVYSAATLSDGKTILVGGFSMFNKHKANGILRLNIDGTFDETFIVDTLPVIDDISIYSVNILPDNKIIIAGRFTDYFGSGRKYLARLHSDGRLDTTFNPSTINNFAITTAILPDGKVLVAFNGGKYISRLNTNGSLDTSFNIGLGANNYAQSISILTDNSVILTGYFDKFSGVTCFGIIKLLSNGNIDPNFILENINGYQEYQYVDSTGRIYITGNFDSVGIYKRNGIARLNANGSLDLNYNPGQNLPTLKRIHSISKHTNGKILLAGNFESNNTDRKILFRFNTDGSIDTSFKSYAFGSNVGYFVSQTLNNKILLCGDFIYYNNKRCPFYVRLNEDGTIDYNFHKETGVGGEINSIEKYGSNKILIAGYFGSYNGNDSIRNIAIIKENGELDPSFKANVDGLISNTVPLANGKIIIVGEFKNVNNITKNGIARLNPDGSLDPTFNTNGIGPNRKIDAIVKLRDNKFYLLGFYNYYNGTPVKGVIKIFENGTLDSNFKLKPYSGLIRAMAIDSSENLYLFGPNNYDSINCNSIIRLNANAELDTLYTKNQPANALKTSFRKLMILDNQKLITIGSRSNYNPGVYLFNYDGSSNTEFNSNVITTSNSTFHKIIKVNKRLLIYGYFTKFNNVPRVSLIRIYENGILDTSFNIGKTPISLVNALYMDNNSNYLIGGNFIEFGNIGRNGLCKINCSILSVGVEKNLNEKSTTIVYPNPSDNTIYLNNSSITHYIIYTNSGQIIQSGKYYKTNGINISELPNSLYTIELVYNNESKSYHRFIKK